jgi:2-dehydro-3-deoxyphosphogluconate aldolase/(4S)-4-hydroxy-2-oxoglutarate aldolase
LTASRVFGGDVVRRIADRGLVPVVEVGSPQDAPRLMEALLRGGLDIVEITLRTESGLAALELLRMRYPEALVGGGTVRTRDAATRVLAAGAQFVVSPSTNVAVVELCVSEGVPVLPGACTPTEIDRAVELGADSVKFFPAEAMGGVPFLKALAGPYRNVSFIPTGGINARNLADYLRAPGVIACGGSWMVAPALIAERRFDEIETLTRQAVEVVRSSRSSPEAGDA